MNFIFRGLLTLNATSWMLVIYGIKEGVTLWNIPRNLFSILLLCIPFCLSIISICLSALLGTDSLDDCKEFGLADNEFLPTYLGYFFVSLGISDITTMMYVYVIVFIFTFVSQTQYFNPIFLLFGYHYYHILTKRGTRVFVIARGKVIRNIKDISFNNLKRINNTTYIQRKRRNR